MNVSKLFLASFLALAIGLVGLSSISADFESEVGALSASVGGLAGGTGAASLVPGAVLTDTLGSTQELTGPIKVITAITQFFSGTISGTLTISDVTTLHDSGWGFGEIVKMYYLCVATGKTPAEIEAMRASGMGWGEISKALGQSPGNKGKNLGAIMPGRGVSSTLTSTVTSTIGTGMPGWTPPGQLKKQNGKGGQGNSPGNGRGR